MRNRSSIRILKHHRTSDVYIDASGRYLHVSMKISLRSKKGRSIARETAQTIVGALTPDIDTATTDLWDGVEERDRDRDRSSSMEGSRTEGS